MTADLHRLRLVRLVVLLLLGVIALQAIPTRPLPAHVDRGSAFSASTLDVSLVAREQAAEQQALPALGDGPASPEPATLSLVPTVVAPAHGWPGRYQTGPPPRPVRSPVQRPRGPPTS